MKFYYVFSDENDSILNHIDLNYDKLVLPDGKTVVLTKKKLESELDEVDLSDAIQKIRERKYESGVLVYKESSVKIFERNNSKLLNLVYGNDWIDRTKLPLKYYKDYDKLLTYLNNNKLSNNECMGMLKAFMAFSRVLLNNDSLENKYILDKYDKRLKYYKNVDMANRVNRDLSEKEINNKVSRKDVADMFNLYFNSFKDDDAYSNQDIKLLLLGFYHYLPPLRQNEIINCLAWGSSDNKEDNYIDWDNKKLVVRNHKTYQTYSNKVIDLPEELLSLINRVRSKIPGGKYLLCRHNGAKNESSNVSHIIASIFSVHNKRVTCNILRKCLISERIKDASADEKAKLASICGHNTTTQYIDYGVYNRDSDDEEYDMD